MIGTKVTLRLRMGTHDAHYAGELVDGARMLALFGDLATELLIRLDGDEGLFRAYENVEFLAPVFAGDYIEATAELVEIGNSSRKMKFEARKVIANVRRPGVPASAADLLADPIVVCRAVGTCVTPKDLQRKPPPRLGAPPEPFLVPTSDPMPHTLGSLEAHSPEIILTAAIVGAEVTREHTPHLPITAQEIADEAARCREAGVAVIHLHVRNDDGSPTQSRDRFADAMAKIRQKKRWDEAHRRARSAFDDKTRRAILANEHRCNLGWRLYKALQLYGCWSQPYGYPIQLFGPWTRSEGPWKYISDFLLNAHRDHIHAAK
jgi:3-keto-5-aminohexanoate cleavage enzyme